MNHRPRDVPQGPAGTIARRAAINDGRAAFIHSQAGIIRPRAALDPSPAAIIHSRAGTIQ